MAASVTAPLRGTHSEARFEDGPFMVSYDRYVPYDTTQVLRKDPTVIFVNFKLDNADIDMSLLNNAELLGTIVSRVRMVADNPAMLVRCIQIVGLASFEGAADYNYRLGMRRAEALRDYILQQMPSLKDDVFELYSAGEAWMEFRSQVEDAEFQGKKQVLDIIDKTANLWLRERRIKDLNDGKVYQYLKENLLSDQRGAACLRIYYDEIPQPVPEPEPEPEPETEPETAVEPETEPETPVEPEPELEPEREAVPMEDDPHWIAVKTNMLFDAALAPNVEVERWFGRNNRFSLMAEVWFPWYVWKSNSRAYEVLTVGLEGRYWLTHSQRYPLRPITGLFVGAYAAGGKYDLEWKSKGYQGEFTSLGLSFGYTWRIGRNLNMEASVAGGWVAGPYRRYEGMFKDTHLIWQRSEHLSYFGPTKLKFSLVWLWPERRRR